MNHLNSVLIEGYLLADPVFKTVEDGPDKGKQLCQFVIASNRYKGNAELEKEVTTVHIEALGKFAEACGNQGKKGRHIRLVGRLKQKYWDDEDGKQRFSLIVIAEHIEFVSQVSGDTASQQGENGE